VHDSLCIEVFINCLYTTGNIITNKPLFVQCVTLFFILWYVRRIILHEILNIASVVIVYAENFVAE